MNLGFIGLGIMGSRMAANLLEAGHTVTITNRSPDKGQDLIKAGAAWADSVAGVAAQSDIVFTMLAHPKAVEGVAPEIVLNLSAGKLWVDSTTTHPAFARQMATLAHSNGIHFIDAPVAGSKYQAENKQLVFFAGGAEEDVAQATPYLKAMGQRVVHVGPQGMGISLKVVVNHLLGTSMAAFAEALALGNGLGLSREMLLNALIGGPVTPPYLTSKKEKLSAEAYDDTEFPLKWMQKDMNMVAIAANANGVPMPLANLTEELFQSAVQAGLGDLDFSALGSK